MLALQELAKWDQWVCWSYERRKGKLTKIPKNPHTGGNALSTEPDTWSDINTAVAAKAQYGFDGVGFVFSENDPFCGIDLDDCIVDSEMEGVDKILLPWAQKIIDDLDTYTEISPSGRGLKLFCRAKLPPGGRKRGRVEMYDNNRYFTVTNDVFIGRDEIHDRQEQVEELHRIIFGDDKSLASKPAGQNNGNLLAFDDRALIERAAAARNGEKFSRLFRGDASDYYSPSEAELALLNILAFWTANDPDQMDRIFRESGLYREKWDTIHSAEGKSYGQMTIEKAIANQSEVYHPPARNGNGKNGDADEPEANQSHYSVQNGCMLYTYYKTVSGDIIPVEKVLAPFVCRITEKLTIFNDYDQEVFYALDGHKGKRKFSVKVAAEEWADPRKLVVKILSSLPGKPPETDPTLRKHWGPAISALTDEEEMDEIRAIPATGWAPDGKAYVMPGGSVGEGYICQMDDVMHHELGQFFGLREQSREENRQALAALLSLSLVYPRPVIYVLLAHAFLPPLLRWAGNTARYLLHIHADTGSTKTELAKFVMALYGPTGDQALTYKWSNTPYGADSRAYVLKDALMLIDDLKPGTINETDKQKWVAFVQAAVDAQGRKRASITGRAQASLPPRALIISTGEAIPEAGEASYTARMLLAEMEIKFPERNTFLDQIFDAAGLLSGLMHDFIAWLLAGDGHGTQGEYQALQATEGVETKHARLSNNFSANRLGMVMLVKFLIDQKYVSTSTGESLLANHRAGLEAVVSQTDQKVYSERYSQRFLSALEDALSTGFAKLSDEPTDRRVGWQDDQYIYLLSGAKEIVDQWLRQSGQTPINISKKDLRKQLWSDGLTYSTDSRIEAGRYDCQAIDPATGSRPMTIALFKGALEEIKTDD